MRAHRLLALSLSLARIPAAFAEPPAFTEPSAVAEPAAFKEPVAICLGSSNPWPPYTYSKANVDSNSPEATTGAAFDLIQTALKMANFDYKIQFLPWSRVQAELAEFGNNKKCELTWDASYNPERAEKFFFSAPLYRTHLGVFYSKKKFTSPPTAESLNNHDVCGVIGFNYAPYGINRKMALVNSVQQALGMVAAEHCDLFPSEIEVVKASAAINVLTISDEVDSIPLPGLTKTFYAMVAKTSPRALELAVQLNQAIIALQASGEAEKMFHRYQAAGSGL